MALLNGIYIHVTSEELDDDVQASEHSVETGADITDHIKPQAIQLSLEGELVNYTGYISETKTNEKMITAWISLVKKDGSAFDKMSFDRLNNEILTFEGGANWVNSGAVQYIDINGNLVNCALGDTVSSIYNVYAVKFEVSMPYGATVRIQNDYKDYCCFNIINKSTTSYNVRDYDADALNTNDFVLSNTYNGMSGRVRTAFTNYDTESTTTTTSETRSAAWIKEYIQSLEHSGSLVTYEGRNYLQNYQIRNFHTGHPNEITGGASFSMTLKQFRGASNSYTEQNGTVASGGTQQISTGDNTEVWHEVKLGDNLYNLITQYGNLKRDAIDGVQFSAIDWVMKKNPHAFDDTTDCSTLKAYERILLGYR